MFKQGRGGGQSWCGGCWCCPILAVVLITIVIILLLLVSVITIVGPVINVGIGTVIVISLVIPLLFTSSTHNPPHEQWLMELGMGAQACPSCSCGSHFMGL